MNNLTSGCKLKYDEAKLQSRARLTAVGFLRAALDDLERLVTEDEHEVNLHSEWLAVRMSTDPTTNSRCSMCMAGAVMFYGLGMDPRIPGNGGCHGYRSIAPKDVKEDLSQGDLGYRLSHMLLACDDLRSGRLSDMLRRMQVWQPDLNERDLSLIRDSWERWMASPQGEVYWLSDWLKRTRGDVPKFIAKARELMDLADSALLK